MPVILAIETATSICSIALSKGDDSFHEISLQSNRRHNEVLPGMVEQLLSDRGMKSKDIDVLAVSIGPGSFSGLRVGLSWAKGFSLGAGATVIPVETLDGIALRMKEYLADQSSEDKQSYSFCPLVPARKGESFGRIYRCSGDEIISRSETILVNEQQLVEILPEDCYLAGEGADVIAEGAQASYSPPFDSPPASGGGGSLVVPPHSGERGSVVVPPQAEDAGVSFAGFKYISNLPASATCIGELALRKLKDIPESIPSMEELEPLYLKEFTVRAG